MRRRAVRPDAPIIPDCPDCRRGPLELVQPDESRPDVVFGSCPCGGLYSVAPLADAVGWDDAAEWAIVGRVGLLAAG